MTLRHPVLATRMPTKENGYFCRIVRQNAYILSQCTALCCVVLQRVAERCSALQCVAVRCSALHCVALRCIFLQCVGVCGSAWQCVAVCCSASQCIAVRCVAACPHETSATRSKRSVIYISIINPYEQTTYIRGTLPSTDTETKSKRFVFIVSHKGRVVTIQSHLF